MLRLLLRLSERMKRQRGACPLKAHPTVPARDARRNTARRGGRRTKAEPLKVGGSYDSASGAGSFFVDGTALPVCAVIAIIGLVAIALAAVLAPGGCSPPDREQKLYRPSQNG